MGKDLQEELYKINKLLEDPGFQWLTEEAQERIQARWDFMAGVDYNTITIDDILRLAWAAAELKGIMGLINLPKLQQEVIRQELKGNADERQD